MQNQPFTACVNPYAMFPKFDLFWVNLFESRGIDAPCEFYALALNLTGLAIFSMLALLTIGGFAFFQSWKENRRWRKNMR